MKSLWLMVGLLLCAPALFAGGKQEDDRAGLLAATVTAIDLEIASTKAKLDTAQAGTGPAENVEKLTRQLADLQAERAKFEAMTPQEYPEPVAEAALEAPIGPMLPPVLAEAVITVGEKLSDGSLLDVQGASRSGPFYHLAGIKGGDYGVLKQGRTYKVRLALVYRREYFAFIGDYYAYILSVE